MHLKLVHDHQETILLQGDAGGQKKDIPDRTDGSKQELSALRGD
jgi:hypothetical protein